MRALILLRWPYETFDRALCILRAFLSPGWRSEVGRDLPDVLLAVYVVWFRVSVANLDLDGAACLVWMVSLDLAASRGLDLED